MKYIFNRFNGYTEDDCHCEYCLHYAGKRKGCQLEQCCCEEERRIAMQQKPEHGQQQTCNPPKAADIAVVADSKCYSCNFAGTGFICGSVDGPCMKNGYGRESSCRDM